MNFEQKLKEFFERIEECLQDQEVPAQLRGLITYDSLQSIYRFVYQNQGNIRKALEFDESCFLDKENTMLSRSLTIVKDSISQDIFLVLETKSKDENNVKYDLEEMFFSGHGKIKPAWVIDVFPPVKIANLVYNINDENSALYHTEKNILEKIIKQGVNLPLFVTSSITKIKKKPCPIKGAFYTKASFYFAWPTRKTLAVFLNSHEATLLTPIDCHKIAIQMIQAIKTLHEMGVVHQNISSRTFFIFENELGGYSVKLSTFGETYDRNNPHVNSVAVAQPFYESPQIAVSAKDPKSTHHERYYQETNFISYARKVAKKLTYQADDSKVDPANDMWALGVVLCKLYYKERPTKNRLKQCSDLIAGLLHPNKQQRLTADQALDLLAQEIASYQEELRDKINQFFERISIKVKASNIYPLELLDSLSSTNLESIFAYVLEYREKISMALMEGHPYRLDKIESELRRTLNFIFDAKTNDIFLILETKNKNLWNRKKTSKQIFFGTSKTTKPAWRIDCLFPKKYANSVFYAETEDRYLDAKVEAAIYKKIVQNDPKSDAYVNICTQGAIIPKSGIRKGEAYYRKISFYSLWANEGDLGYFIGDNKVKLSNNQFCDIAKALVKGLSSLHAVGVIHQDIKLQNILVYSSIAGYSVKWTDVGLAYSIDYPWFNRDALATISYESPELSAFMATQKPGSYHYNYFMDPNFSSYGRMLRNQVQVQSAHGKPHTLNDVWSLGITLYRLFYNDYPTVQSLSHEEVPALFKGLLSPLRENRLSVKKLVTAFFPENQAEDEVSNVMSHLSIRPKTYAPHFDETIKERERKDYLKVRNRMRKSSIQALKY